MIARGWYTTKDGHRAKVLKDSERVCTATVIGVGIVGYDMQGQCVNEQAPEGLTLDLTNCFTSLQELIDFQSQPSLSGCPTNKK